MKKDKILTILFLAISVAILVPTWGTFHATAGVQKGWIAFLSAAVFFAAGHKVRDCANVVLSHLLGVFWGLSILYLWENPPIPLNGVLYTFLTLALFGFLSAVVTNIGIDCLSHTPSLFCGWAIAFAVFGGLPVSDWQITNIGETLLACVIGVLFVGLGIAQLHRLLIHLFLKNHLSEETKPSADKIKPMAKTKDKEIVKAKNRSAADNKMSQYLQEYSVPETETENNKRAFQDIQEGLSELRYAIQEGTRYTGGNSSETGTRVKIIGVCGSPHKKGSTIEYLKVALQAAEEIGNVDIELVELAGKEIKPCLGCKSNKCGGTCIISDYMQELYPKLRGCDGLILASPSYFGTFSGQLKLFLDRLRVMRHSNFELGNVVVGTLAVAGRRHGGQEITNIDLIQSMMRHNTIIVNDGTAVCQLGATGWSHTFDDPATKAETDDYGMQTAVGVGKRVAEIAKVVKASGLQNVVYEYNQKIGKR